MTKENKIEKTRLNGQTQVDGIRILAEMTRRDIERTISFDGVKDAEAYYSQRHGWSLRKKAISN